MNLAPLFDLRIHTPRLELRFATDADLVRLAKVADEGVTEPDDIFLLTNWDALPLPLIEREMLGQAQQLRTDWQPESRWHAQFVVCVDGEPIGVQELQTSDFTRRRVVETHSWLGEKYQGQGYGTEMRAAVLFLAFEHLGAIRAESGYLEGNTKAVRVSERLGYRANGTKIVIARECRIMEYRLLLERESWKREAVPVSVEHVEACLLLFGARAWTNRQRVPASSAAERSPISRDPPG